MAVFEVQPGNSMQKFHREDRACRQPAELAAAADPSSSVEYRRMIVATLANYY